jgi:hypothetical protein
MGKSQNIVVKGFQNGRNRYRRIPEDLSGEDASKRHSYMHHIIYLSQLQLNEKCDTMSHGKTP